AYETLAFDPRSQLRPISVRPYPGGDYIVTFNATGGLFPYGGGIGRVASDGTPRWFRFDYTHHWANLAEDGTILVPGMRIGTAADGQRLPPRARCKSNRPMIDTLRVIDGDGAILREIDLYEALLDANFEGLLATTHNPCDPLHLNFVHPIGADATAGLTPGDYLVSLRNISAVAVIDRITGAVKRMIHGNFEHQHAAQHIGGSKIVLFDNWGGDLDGPASQIVEIDLATGAERTVFPIPGGDQEIPDRFSLYAGTINLSPDRRRILTAYTWNGHGYEIDLATGTLLGVYENRHPTGGGETARYYLFDLSYLLP
ncbi:MAG: arylsulfotransferase family protein, partial [Pseudomonadota bacterium]